ANPKVSGLLDDMVSRGVNPKDAAGWILTDCAGILRKDGKSLSELEISADKLFAVIKMVNDGDINRNAGKKALIAVVEKDVDPVTYCKENGLDRKIDTSTIEKTIDKVLENNQQALEDFRNGKEKAKQALFGACMKELKGAGDPSMIKELLDEKLK
ncbi:MAG: Asp-tRNA(Asn)/Glu-tRNA(Gln) amidotransferase subunit GatB, partial [Oscillospiraceae bacterium]|nr:Asp-tRNA(Asn)/Glu-tRNA(Gln) amidotransferase subunit GatB [Oscillospiraceae bacterium]